MKNLKAVTQFENTGWPPKCQSMNQNFEIKTYDPKDTTTEDFFKDSQFEKATTPTKPASLESMVIESRNILLTLDTASERSEKKLQRVLEILGELESVVRNNIIRINTVGFSNRA